MKKIIFLTSFLLFFVMFHSCCTKENDKTIEEEIENEEIENEEDNDEEDDREWNVRKGDTYAISRLIQRKDEINSDPNLPLNNATCFKWNVCGTDLGSMFLHNNKIYMVFGDTFGKMYKGNPRDHRSNVIAISSDSDPSDGITFDRMITDENGRAKELIKPEEVGQQMTIIPTYGISLNNRIYLHYMALKEWGGPGEWDLNKSGLAYSDDDGETWTISNVSWSGDSNFGQIAFVKKENYVYLFGIPGGRFGGVKLARVDEQNILKKPQYEYWVGDQWKKNAEETAKIIIEAPVGELSVRWNSYYSKWIMMTKHQQKGGPGFSIVLRTSNHLEGSWSEEKTVIEEIDVSGKGGFYAPYIAPKWNDGPDIYFTLSRFDPIYEVRWWHTSLK